MLIDVEHTPHIIVGTPATTPLVSGLLLLGFHSSFNQLERTATKVSDGDADSVSMASGPMDEVVLLGAGSFDKHQQLDVYWAMSDLPLRPAARSAATQSRSPALMSSAAASNS